MIAESDSRAITAAVGRGGARAPWLTLLGPAFAVSVGYIDPGNWATDLAAGAFQFRLLWVIVAANLLAIVLQIAVVRLTTATGDDLATLLARRWPRAAKAAWPLFQCAIAATDVAELTGVALGIQLLFHCSMAICVAFAVIGVLSLFCLSPGSSKRLEMVLIFIVALIAIAYVYQMHRLHPPLAPIVHGALVPAIPNRAALLVTVGIIGATVMPHNLFLHSALVARSGRLLSPERRKERGRFYLKETLLALNVAALINGGILVVGAMLRGANGSLSVAYQDLGALAGGAASVIFGAALLLSGLAAATTATLSGDYISAALAPVRIPVWARRALTLLPAVIALLVGITPMSLLTWSQVILALVLPVVVVPLLVLLVVTKLEGAPWIVRGFQVLVFASAMVCIGFDGILLVQSLH